MTNEWKAHNGPLRVDASGGTVVHEVRGHRGQTHTTESNTHKHTGFTLIFPSWGKPQELSFGLFYPFLRIFADCIRATLQC